MYDTFEELGLRDELLQVIGECGYAAPTPIQSAAIPALLAGRDVFGQAQTGTGKTAAFALPMLNGLDTSARSVQALVLTPTRELAAQVSESIHTYGGSRKVRVLPIYGGQSYDRQQRRLERGVHVVVGTPGRIIDLMNQRLLDLSSVTYVVLDEADEMLKMGFIDDVETILSAVPGERQTAMFSATLPPAIRALADRHMREPLAITIEQATLTVPQIEQRYYLVREEDKLAALCRLLETEALKSALIFTRTRAGSMDLAEALLERGFMADALNGELSQAARESVLRRFRGGQLPILVATDVVARGVDISDVSHVFNYDMPYDSEDYVHRIGRTGRAGRDGIAIMLVTPRERRRLRGLELFTRQPITRAELPKLESVRDARQRRFILQVDDALTSDLTAELALVEELAAADYDLRALAAAAIRMARADEALRPVEHIKPVKEDTYPRGERTFSPRYDQRRPHNGGGRPNGNGRSHSGEDRPRRRASDAGMVRLLINAGENQGIRPGDVVGAIAGEAGIPGRAIGAIDIQHNQTYFDLEAAHLDKVLRQMSSSRLRGKPVHVTLVE